MTFVTKCIQRGAFFCEYQQGKQTVSQLIQVVFFPLTPPPLTWTTERMKFVLKNVFFIFPEINDLDYFFSFSKLCWEILSLPPSCHSPLHTHCTDTKISGVVCFDGMMCQASFMNNSNIFALNTQFTCVKNTDKQRYPFNGKMWWWLLIWLWLLPTYVTLSLITSVNCTYTYLPYPININHNRLSC